MELFFEQSRVGWKTEESGEERWTASREVKPHDDPAKVAQGLLNDLGMVVEDQGSATLLVENKTLFDLPSALDFKIYVAIRELLAMEEDQESVELRKEDFVDAPEPEI